MQWVGPWVISLVAIVPWMMGCAGSTSVSPQSSAAVASSPVPVDISLPAKGNQSLVAASEANLWARLRRGKGYVVLFRHALAPGTGDPPNFRLGDCSTQRNLSAEGRQQAVRIGEVFRQQKIPIARVLSSQWCRCVETARLMNLGPVEPFSVLNSFFQDRATEGTQTEQLRQFIVANQKTTGVIILVTHQVNITAISNIVPNSGEAIVMKASDANQIQWVGQLNPSEH